MTVFLHRRWYVMYYTYLIGLIFSLSSSSTSVTALAVKGGLPVLSFQLPRFVTNFLPKPPQDQFDIKEKKHDLLESISNTNSGKTATTEQQRSILSQVRQIETSNPPPSTLFTDKTQIEKLDGVWFLKYTSPSSIDDDDDDADDDGADEEKGEEDDEQWTPTIAEDSKIETRQIRMQGSVSAAGITVDVSNKDTRQIFNFDSDGEVTVSNEVELDFGMVVVGGGVRPSDLVYNRLIVSFTICQLILKNGFILDLGFLFAILSIVRGTPDAGWLETTYVDDDIRLGRGNKGTMFILTREK
eukprot:CAMPEP_0198248884 /NCGR_PEP_ID=MMETSP1447-20131203/545_1 /TAXON_ID=420782 /ORGANISM="Chaetoceros dichaeta, Strain CCMP1751" /LENGTH=298 /DNA_ID=CAMNT_0043933375 /DNA_START=43 /DNA_END=939 /DNA_ORIENTATION=+